MLECFYSIFPFTLYGLIKHFFTIFIANLNRSFGLYSIEREEEALCRSYFLIISGQRKKTIMSLLCTTLLKNTSNFF
jgi:hypothetical protein